MSILAGDIGGTKTLLQLAEPTSTGFQVLFEKRYASADYADFLPLLQDFLASVPSSQEPPTAACFGIAGPIQGRTAKVTNLPWLIDTDHLQQILGIAKISLINDFQAVGYGIEGLQVEDFLCLQAGEPVAQATRVVIGAGTGLGHGFLVWQGHHYEVLPSEGGHADFAPRNDIEIALLDYLRHTLRWHTWEYVVSGMGLVNIYNFLCEYHERPIAASIQQAWQQEEDKAAVISRFALNVQDATAVDALALFVSIYGAQAGNFALTALAQGGVYIAGGIAPKIISKLQDGAFMHAFLDKYAPMQSLLEAMPVHVVMNEQVGLLGAAMVASRL